MSLYPVVLCGGSGSRLWPASRPGRPKQFLPLVGERSSFQDTLLRLAAITGAKPPIVVTGKAMVDDVVAQSTEIAVAVTVLIEPEARDSGPAVAAAAAYVKSIDPNGVILMLASDHYIGQPELFAEAALLAAAAADAEGVIVTFGVQPTSPATGYGYIRPGAVVSGSVRRVDAFVEKPDAATALTHVAAGYLWNSGNFAFRADVILEEMEVFEPALAEGAAAAVAAAVTDGALVRLDAEAFARATAKSLDYAVMERTKRAAVVPASFSWSDLGAWDSIWEASDRDHTGNSITGDALLIDTTGTLVRTDGPFVGVIGLNDVAVIVDGGSVLVCRREDAQKVKGLVDALKARGG
jgi:mannose-1-phosphate guanylyltransferase/mannose-6-phosphate isomerase